MKIYVIYYTLVAVGGTALTLLNLKESTKDIDFVIPEKGEEFEKLFKKLGIEHLAMRRFKTKSGFIMDLYRGSYIFTTALPLDFVDKSRLIKDLGNIRLYALGLHDIIISKMARSSKGDEEDVKRIFEKSGIDVAVLKKRYDEIHILNYDNTMDYHFERLLTVLLPEWGISVRKK